MTRRPGGANDSARGEKCPACGGPGRSRNYEVDDFDLYRCRLCRTEFLVQSPDRPPVENIFWDRYKFELYANPAVQAEYEQRYRLLLDEVSRFETPRTVLDVGCGIGNFVEYAERQGISAVGADVDDDAIATARGRGLTAWHVDELAERVEPGSVDLITLWDVIEHVQDPHALLRQALPHLRPGGYVILETPDVQFPARQLAIGIRKVAEPVRWSDIFYYAGHKIYFSGRGLSNLLASCGLDVVSEFGMRSPSAKMANIVDLWADKRIGAGRAGPFLNRSLDTVMKTTGITNKLIMIGQLPAGD